MDVRALRGLGRVLRADRTDHVARAHAAVRLDLDLFIQSAVNRRPAVRQRDRHAGAVQRARLDRAHRAVRHRVDPRARFGRVIGARVHAPVAQRFIPH